MRAADVVVAVVVLRVQVHVQCGAGVSFRRAGDTAEFACIVTVILFLSLFSFGELANLLMKMKDVTLDADIFMFAFRMRGLGRGDFSVYPDRTGPPVGWQPWPPLLQFLEQGARIKHEALLMSRACTRTSTDEANGMLAV